MIFIISPHPDDELIGNFEILNEEKNKNIIIIYTEPTIEIRKSEALQLKNIFPNIKAQIFSNNLPPTYSRNDTFYFPNPIDEIHPEHRLSGILGESMLRNGYDVIFYSTIMNTPYIHKVKYPDEKKETLNKVYPSQRSLWEYDYKYFLYEARVKWLM